MRRLPYPCNILAANSKCIWSICVVWKCSYREWSKYLWMFQEKCVFVKCEHLYKVVWLGFSEEKACTYRIQSRAFWPKVLVFEVFTLKYSFTGWKVGFFPLIAPQFWNKTIILPTDRIYRSESFVIVCKVDKKKKLILRHLAPNFLI